MYRSHKKMIRRILALLMSAAVLLCAYGTGVNAAEDTVSISGYEGSTPFYTASVNTGAAEADSGMPESVRVLIPLDELNMTEADFTSVEPDEDVLTEMEACGYTSADRSVYEYDAVYLRSEDSEQEYRVYGYLGEDESLSSWFACDAQGVVFAEIREVGVTWVCEDYDSEMAGEYMFTATAEGYSFAGEAPTAVITVTGDEKEGESDGDEPTVVSEGDTGDGSADENGIAAINEEETAAAKGRAATNTTTIDVSAGDTIYIPTGTYTVTYGGSASDSYLSNLEISGGYTSASEQYIYKAATTIESGETYYIINDQSTDYILTSTANSASTGLACYTNTGDVISIEDESLNVVAGSSGDFYSTTTADLADYATEWTLTSGGSGYYISTISGSTIGYLYGSGTNLYSSGTETNRTSWTVSLEDGASYYTISNGSYCINKYGGQTYAALYWSDGSVNEHWYLCETGCTSAIAVTISGSAKEAGTITLTADDGSSYILNVQGVSTVDDTVTPSGTVINLFDYWLTNQDDADNHYTTDGELESGINKGHTLKFTRGRYYASNDNGNYYDITANDYTGSSAVRSGIAADMLSGLYPVLSGGTAVTNSTYGSTNGYNTQSLQYLFDPTYVTDGKESYRAVSGLLQIDAEGYYYYDSTKNYAEYDKSTNSFTLYDDWAVYGGGNGQFFPFDSYDTVTRETSAYTEDLNHYFGLTLSTRFSQQYDGHTSSSRNTATTFEFSGDDDVWIYIDGVLVADLGGIHDASSVVIDFSTGNVTINGTVTNTLKSAYEAAGVAGNEEDWNGNTYANNTYHTLKFFYLERGNSASNLSLKYNLTEIPETGIYKVNQYENPVEGAGFSVYKATADTDGNYYYLYDDNSTKELASDVTEKLDKGTYTLNENGDICDSNGIIISSQYTGTTDANGEMIFLDDDSMPYSLTELESMFGTYFILKETKVPEGYRLVSEDIYLEIVSKQVLVCNNTYDSGVYASTNLLVTATDTLYSASTGEEITYHDVTNNVVTGTLFAVVLKYVGTGNPGEDTSDESWVPVYGSDESGYTVMDSLSIANVIYAAQQMEENGYSDSVFTMSGSGSMQLYLTSLPGAIQTYYYLAEDKSDTQYTVAYYYSTADSLTGADSSNTVRVVSDEGKITSNSSIVDYSGFYRTFGATIEVPNLSNALLVQKLDEEGNLINGAKFAMYKVAEVADPAGGTSTIYYLAADGTYIYLYPDEDGDNQGSARLQADSQATGTYTINPGEGTNGDTNEGVITVTIGTDVYYIYPTEVETTMEEGSQKSSVTGASYDTSEDGTAVFDNLSETTYYVREISAPDGYLINSTEIMVLVAEDTIYANAGAADDGVTVARAAGYIVATLDQMAAVGDIDNTLSWIYTTLFINTDQLNTFDFDTYESGSSLWSVLLNSDNYAKHAYLTYDEDHVNELFNYVTNEARWDADGYTGTRRLYTDEGWSYLQIFQDNAYYEALLAAATANGETLGYDYTNLGTEEITNLFSRSVYIQVTDEKTKISFSKISGENVKDDNSDGILDDAISSADLLSDAIFGIYSAVYDENENSYTKGNAIETTDSNGAAVNYTAASDVNGTATFEKLEPGTYWVEEMEAPDGYMLSSWHWIVTIDTAGNVIFTYVGSGGSGSLTGLYTYTDADDVETYYWPDYQVYELPTTGANGVYLYLMSGVIMIISAGALWLYMRNSRRKEVV